MKVLLIIWELLLLLSKLSNGFLFCEKEAFIAAVVEYKPVELNMSISAHANMMRNVKQLEAFVHQASLADADILVFPEYGLTSTKIQSLSLQEYDYFAQEIPTHPFDPCSGHALFWSILEHISCMAFKYNIHLVVNLITRSSKGQYFNTALAFDVRGQIAAEYQKFNIYAEKFISKPEEPQVVIFETKAGVRVGLMICFDINYPDPALSLAAQVDVIAYPTAWTDELPFLTAPQYHMGWAIANGVTILAAGYHDLSSGSSGSGIYQLNHLTLAYRTTESSQLLLSNQLLYSSNSTFHQPFFLYEDLAKYTKVLLPEGKHQIDLKYANFACQITYDGQITAHFQAVIYSGERTFANGQFSAQIQACGIIPENLTNSVSAQFASLQIKGYFSPSSVPMPVSLDASKLPFFGFSYSREENVATMELIKDDAHLFSFALYARKMM